MNENEFEQQDAFIRKNLESVRPREVPREVLKGFRESVEKQILAGGGAPAGHGFSVPAAALAVVLAAALGGAAVFMLASRPDTAVEIKPEFGTLSAPQETPGFTSSEVRTETASPEADVLTDVEVLEALGVWTEEDDRSVGFQNANRFQEVELLFDTEALPHPAAF